VTPGWLRRIRQGRRERLVESVERVRGFMLAVIADARRAGVDVPIGVTASVDVWRFWQDRLERQADEQ
jgi:hypothetical protein